MMIPRILRSLPPASLLLAASGCPPAVPPGAATPGGGPSAAAAEAGPAPVLPALPAGPFYALGYLRNRLAEERFPDPRFAVVLGPVEEAAQAERLARSAPAGLPPGWPWVAHTDEIGAADPSLEGILVVLGLFVDRADAESWTRDPSLGDVRVVGIADPEAAWERLAGGEADYGRWGETRHVVRIAPGDPVPAYPREAIERLEQSEDGRGGGGDPAPAFPAPLCTLEPGAVYVATERESYFAGRRWAPFACGDAPAAVRRTDTLVESVVVPRPGGGAIRIQIGDVACDVPCFCEWPVDGAGRRILDDPDDADCDCVPSCGGEACS